METEKTLTERIMAITLEINEKYPELSKNIIETPLGNSTETNSEVNKGNLREYYDSLIEMIKKYAPTHLFTKNKK